MAYPSDYRYNPFSDVSTAILAIERHIIPATSPYVISLNEVPQKNSPSTMTVKEITAVSGDTVTYGSTFAEVSANPASGEFWSDYNTGADGDKGWNTGKLLFAASDAGKLVEVTYTATGTLAGVKSNRFPSWWLDRGDGSDGDFRPTENTTISGLKQYRSVFIPAGVTVSVDKYVRICCQGAFVNIGTISANGQGAAGGTSGHAGTPGMAGSGGVGGARNDIPGGAGYVVFDRGLSKDAATSLVADALRGYGYGAGGGSGGTSDAYPGGNGGGSIVIISNSLKNIGVISANGTNGVVSAGGGGGGVVVLIANSIIEQGIITVNGGTHGSSGGVDGDSGISIIKELGVM